MKVVLSFLIISGFLSITQAEVSPLECNSFIDKLSSYDFALFMKKRDSFQPNDLLAPLETLVTQRPEIVNCVDQYGNTPLSSAVSDYHNNFFLNIAIYLVENGAEVNLRGNMNLGPLPRALFFYSFAYGSGPRLIDIDFPSGYEAFHEISEEALRNYIYFLVNRGALWPDASKYGDGIKQTITKVGLSLKSIGAE